MTRKDVRDYIKLSLRVYKNEGDNIDEMTERIIKWANDSSFYNNNSFFWGYLLGCAVGMFSILLNQ